MKPLLQIAASVLIALPSVGRCDEFNTLWHAIRTGDAAQVRELVKAPGQINARDPLGNTPLIVAAMIGDSESVRALLQAGADPNATNNAGASPLLRAAAHPRKVTLLLERGADPNIASVLGHTPLMLAARCVESTESVRLLLEHKASVNASSQFGATALMAAAAAGNLEAAKLLVAAGADVNAVPLPKTDGDPIWGGFRSPLSWAAQRGSVAVTTYLLDNGAAADGVPNPFGVPLTFACWGEQTETARVLLGRNAKVNQTEAFSGYYPLHWAASTDKQDPTLVELLLEHGADPNAEGGQPVDAFLGVPRTPLMLAECRGKTPVSEILLQAGAKECATAETAPYLGPAKRPSPQAVWSAVAAAVPPLQHTAEFSRESFLRHASKQDCTSCHQQYLPMAATGLARTRQVPVDENAAAKAVDLIRTLHGHSELDAQALFHPEPTMTYGYTLMGLRAEGVDDPALGDVYVHHLASIQCEDGHWPINLPRPPIQSSEVTATALAIYCFANFGWPARAAEFQERIGRAKAWLERASPAFTEERVFQLLGLAWAGAPRQDLRPKARELIQEQRPDGGWGQLPGLPSDAYATGQALVALQEAGGFQPGHRAIRRGLRFLLRNQEPDGTWHVKRRAFPFQPTMDSGFPHGRDSWISAAGSSWAVMGMARSLDPASEELAQFAANHKPGAPPRNSEPRAVAGGQASPGAEAVSFEQVIQPLLKRSCVGCHSGEKPKGGYDLTTRENMLRAAALGEPAVVAGRSQASPLVRYVSGLVEEMEMPPLGKREKFPPLSPEEIAMLAAWIDQGAK